MQPKTDAASKPAGARGVDAGAPGIDRDRLRDTFDKLATIGREDDGSINRPAFSDNDMEARRWMMTVAEERGLQASMDEAGNVVVRSPESPDDEPVVMIGSHLDSVPHGGAFDGALGVIIALEILTVVHEAGLAGEHAIEAIAFSDEEGRFGGMLGSRAVAGLLTPADIAQSADLDGVTLREAMKAQGLEAEAALRVARRRDSVRAYLEVHTEQGPVLDGEGAPIGVVTEIAGLFKWIVTLKGRADHAGTAPMHLRADAFGGLAEFSGEIPRILEEHGTDAAVATIGKVLLRPGAANSVPASAEFSLDVRDASANTLKDLGEAMRRALSAIARRRGLMFEFDILESIDPRPCSERVTEAIAQAVRARGFDPRMMPSGAAHDGQMIAHIAPIGMIFTPSVGGRSHSGAEWTQWEDIELAADVALDAALELSVADAETKRGDDSTRGTSNKKPKKDAKS